MRLHARLLLAFVFAAALGAQALAQGLPATKVGTFNQALYDEATKQGWVVISMKNDWKRVFAFEQ